MTDVRDPGKTERLGIVVFLGMAGVLGALVDLMTLLTVDRETLIRAGTLVIVLAGMALVLSWMERRHLLSRRRLVVIAVAGCLLFVGAQVLTYWSKARLGVPVKVFNMTVSGAAGVVPEKYGFLSTVPEKNCRNRCMVSANDNEIHTGDTVRAHCRIVGDMIYNSDTGDASDDRNPDLAQSNVWYRVTNDAGNTGYLSEVFVAKEYRNLPLPACGREG